MEFIEKSFQDLIKHCISKGLDVKQENFNLINSFSSALKKDCINVFLLGVLLNRDKTPKNKIYKEGREYKAGENYFDLYYAIYVDDFEKLSLLLRILSDFEEDEKGNKYRLLNSSKDLQESLLVDNFLKMRDEKLDFIVTNSIFLKIQTSVITLKSIPKTVPVSDVKVNMKRRK